MQIKCKWKASELTGFFNALNYSVMDVSVTIYHDTRRIKQNQKYPVKLRISNQIETPVLYPTVFDLSIEEFNKLSDKNCGKILANIRKKLNELEISAQQLADQVDPFSFYIFERDFVIENPLLKIKKIKAGPPATESILFDFTPYLEKFPILNEDLSNPLTLSALYVNYVKKLLVKDQIGSAENYQDSFKSLKTYWGNITLNDISVDRLNYYEKWMLQKGRSLTTVGIKLRHLRTIFNLAIDAELISKKKYPFGKHKYVIPTASNIKKALPATEVQKIYFYEAKTDDEAYGTDMWLFLYMANGMNPKDMAHLKFKNIDGEFLHFYRAKTRNTARQKSKIITAFITNRMLEIINKWGNKDKTPENYIFPVLLQGQTPMEQHYAVKNFISRISRLIRPVAKSLGIGMKVTPAVARHSHATHLKRAGASTEFIQEALGHHEITTTEFYLDSFEKEIKKEFAVRLVSFKKEGNAMQVS